ncbi:MAG TPA: pyrimidine 5'-nucleotidase [Candidatus Limnocylindria bacterium]|jgi:putative hydrolase of the HAD superfamily|nr:pyrimidine 5'-nucleotidase [Candidatus Limnocylindria bacterium]
MASGPLFVFDLDNTLYPPHVQLWRIVDSRIEHYVQDRLGVDPLTAGRVRKDFLREFGTTLRGLMHYHDVSPAEYLEFVHDVPIPEIVPPRPELGEMLSSLPGRRVVFTNGSESYARRVLSALGISDMMEGIYGIEFMEYVAKPSRYPYEKLLRATGIDPRDSLFCEDLRENLVPARELGMFAVWVGGGEEGFPAHAVIEDVCDLPRILPRFLADGAQRNRERGARQGADGG